MTLEETPRERGAFDHEPSKTSSQPIFKLGNPLPGGSGQKILASLGELLTPDAFSRRKATTRRVGPTAWLDGIRGWAALLVAFMHLTVYTHEGLELCYGAKSPSADVYNTGFAALPLIRLPFTGGHFSVMLFFVISGYVVPRRLIQILHEGRREEFFENFHSVLIRRPVRLFLPVALSTFMFLVVWHTFGIATPWPKQKSNVIYEAFNWMDDMLTFVYFYKIGYLYTYYNVHTWTIPVEFRGSMFLFIWLFMLHSVKTRTRVILTLGMTLYLAIGAPGAWYACFFGGMFLSEVELLQAEGHPLRISFPWDPIDRWFKQRKVLRSVALHLMLAASLYLATQPSSDWSTRAATLGNCHGWQTLSWLIPSSYLDEFSQFRWFWLFWAAWMMVYAVREIAWLRSLFETQTSAYLGKHSFSLYLIHGPMIGIISERLFYMTGLKEPIFDDQKVIFGPYYGLWRDASWWPFPDGGAPGFEPSFWVCVVISIPIFLYVAEVGTRLFDAPSIKASKWAWQKWKTL